MVAEGTAPKINQPTEGASFEPSLRKKELQKVCVTNHICAIIVNDMVLYAGNSLREIIHVFTNFGTYLDKTNWTNIKTNNFKTIFYYFSIY